MKNEPVDLAKNLRRSAVALAVATCFSAGPVWANPTKPVVVNGAASFAQNGNLFTVTNSPNAIINWGSFSIGANEITRFVQQNSASAVLNRVTGQDPSSILGALQSNGRVFLLNPNGVVFGAGSQIDVGGLVASTLNLSNADFLAGHMRFTDGLGNSVINNGNITTPSGGNVYLIGNAVTNNGIITSPKGEVILAAGNSVELVNPGTPNLRVEITAPDNEAKNLGQIVAESGRIGIYAGLINHSGTINANSVEVDQNGQIILKATKNTTLEAGSSTTANGPSGGGITVQSGDTTLVSGIVEAKGLLPFPPGEGGGEGGGGNINILGNLVGLTGNASLNASGETGGGTVLVGGDYQGKNTNVQNAFRAYVGPDASIKADAITSGDGGKVIVWADETTRYYGSISAKGGANSGNGGFVETSGKEFLDASGSVNASAPAGAPGLWLLDPRNVTIGALTLGGVFSGGNPDIFTPSSDDATVSAAVINTALNLGTSVTITTGATGTQNGDITVASPLNWTVPFLLSPQSLTLTANRDINVNANVVGNFTTSNGSAGSINLNAGGKLTVATGNTVSLQGNDSGGGAFNVDIIGTANTFDIQGIIQAQNTGSGTGTAAVSLHTTNGASTPSIAINGGQVLATSSSRAFITLDAASGTAPNIAITNGTVTATGGALGGGFGRVTMTAGSSFSIDNSSITSVTSAGASGGIAETTLNFGGTLDLTNNSLVAATGFNQTGTGGGGSADVFILPAGGAGDLNINSGSAVRSTGGNAASAGGAQSGGQARINLTSNAAVNLASMGGSVLKTTGGNPAGSGTPLGGNSLINVTGATGIQVTGTGTATPAISAETTGTGTAQVTLTATTGGVTVSNAAVSTGLSSAAVRNATTTILANGAGGFINLNTSGLIGAFGNDVSTVSLTTAGSASIEGTLRAQGNARVLGAGNATVGINAGAAGITVQPGGVIDATGSTNSGVASGSGTVSLTSTGGTVLVDGSSITATGAANNSASGGGAGILTLSGSSVTVRNSSTLLAKGGNDTSAGGGAASDTITAASGRADVDASSSVSATGGNSPGSGGAATVTVTGPTGITSGTLNATRGSGGAASAAGVSLTSSGGTVDINSNITVTPATGAGTITVNAGNAITRSAGVLKVVAPASTSSLISLTAASGIGTVAAPIQIFDGTAGVTASNASSGDIVLSQVTGNVSAPKLTLTNSASGGGVDIKAEAGDINITTGTSINNSSGPLTLRASGTINLQTTTAGPLPTANALGSVTLIADDILLQGPVVSNSGTGTINIQTTTAGRTIDLGSTTAPFGPSLALSNTEIGNLSAANTIFGLAANPTQISAAAITTTGTQTYNGPVSLLTDTTLSGTAISFNNTLQSPAISRTLTVNASGVTTFGALVGGGGNPLASLTTDAAGSTAFNGGAITTTGNQTYNDAVILGAATTLSGAAITFGNTLNGAQALTLNASGATTFGGVVGGTTALTSLSTDAAGSTAINGGAITTSGAQTYNDAVTLGAATTLSGSAVSFNGTLNGAQNLTVNASGATTFGGAVGGTTALTSLTTDAAGSTAINGGAVTTTGNQAYNDTLTLGSNTTLASTSLGNIITTGAINGGGFDLTVNTGGTGIVSANNLNSLTTDVGGTTSVVGGINTAGGQTYGDAVTLSGAYSASTFTVSGTTTLAGATTVAAGTVSFTGAVNGASSLQINSAGATTFGAAVGGVTPLASLTTDAAGSTAINGGAITTSGAQTYNDAVTLGAATTLSGSAVSFNGTLNGAQNLTVNASGATTFGGAVGGVTPLASLITDAAGSTAINGGAITTSGAQTYNDAVTLGAATTLTGTAVTFGSTLNGAQALTLNASGATTFGAAVGGTTALTSLTTDAAGSTAINGGAITASGPITLNDAVSGNNVTVHTGANTITMTNPNNDFTGTLTLTGSDVTVKDSNALTTVLNSTGNNTLTAGGDIVANGSFSNLSASTTGAGAGVTASSTTNLTVNNVSANGGPVSLASTGGNLLLNGNISGAGTLTTSATGTQTLSSGTISATNYTLGGSGMNLAGGTLNVSNLLTVQSGATLTNQGSAVNAGTADISGILNPGGGTVAIANVNIKPGGLLKGVGTVGGNVNNDGTVSPGNSPGILNISGDYVQGPTGVLNIEIAGATAGTYDQLIIGGNATLNGTLNTTLLGGYAPTAADTFEILKTSGTTSGVFATQNFPATTSFISNYLSNGVNLLVSTNATNTLVGSILLPATELAPTGVLEQKDIFPSADENQDVFSKAGGTPPPVCN